MHKAASFRDFESHNHRRRMNRCNNRAGSIYDVVVSPSCLRENERERRTGRKGKREMRIKDTWISLGEQPSRDSKERTARAFSDKVRLKFMSLSGLEIAVTCKAA